MIKAFKFQIKTSDKVKQKIEQTLDLCRELYNAGLQERRDAYKCLRKSISYNNQANQLPDISKDRTELKAVHSQVLQDVLKRLDKAFKGFFLRIERGQKAGFPRFVRCRKLSDSQSGERRTRSPSRFHPAVPT